MTQNPNRAMPPVTKLSPEEMALLRLIREKPFQEIKIQIQDGVIVSMDQTTKYRRTKKGLVTGR